MIKNTLIIALVILAIYLYYQSRKLKGLPATADNSSSTVFELDEDKEELIADKDAAIRSKNEAEQEVLSLSNRLKNKQQEVSRKETEIERLKKEKSSSEISLNKKISEKNGLITTLQREINQQKNKITELTNSKSPLPGTFPEEDKAELQKQHQEQLREIYTLFDLRAKGMKEIDFSQLYGLLQKVSKKVDLGKIK
jgi:chromosome segregation ATPase